MLLHRGANPSSSTSHFQTALHIAVRRNFRGVCTKLLEHDAPPTARDVDGTMPYTIALQNQHDDIAAILVAHMTSLAYVTSLYFNN
jgi:ankyrin repeat protein